MRTHPNSIRALWIAAALLTPLMTLSFIGDALAGKIYRCVDDKKKVTVSDTPCVAPAASSDTGTDKSKGASADATKKDDKGGNARAKVDVKG